MMRGGRLAAPILLVPVKEHQHVQWKSDFLIENTSVLIGKFVSPGNVLVLQKGIQGPGFVVSGLDFNGDYAVPSLQQKLDFHRSSGISVEMQLCKAAFPKHFCGERLVNAALRGPQDDGFGLTEIAGLGQQRLKNASESYDLDIF